MHSQEQRFKYNTDREKLVVTQYPKGKFLKKLLALLVVIALSIIIEILLSQMMYAFYHEERGMMGSFLVFVSFSIFDLFAAWIIFAKNVYWKANKAKFRLLLAAISILITVLYSFIAWAAYTSLSVFLATSLTFLCLNLIINMILNRLKKKNLGDYPVDL